MLKQEVEGGGTRSSTATSTSSAAAAVSFCPSFNSYSTGNCKLVDIAAKVSEEEEAKEKENRNHVVEEEFEFVSLSRDDVDGSQLFFDGQIRQVYPVFNRDLLYGDEGNGDGVGAGGKLQFSLQKLFIDERNETPLSSSSSSEDDELERVPEETYCVWSPKKEDSIKSSPFSKKSNSTGSLSTATTSSPSKRWVKFRDLLKRSNSDGKDPFVILSKSRSKPESREKYAKTDKGKGKKKPPVSAHEKFYVNNRAMKEGEKKKSYLPYRQDLLGFFANVGTVGKTFPPFYPIDK